VRRAGGWHGFNQLNPSHPISEWIPKWDVKDSAGFTLQTVKHRPAVLLDCVKPSNTVQYALLQVSQPPYSLDFASRVREYVITAKNEQDAQQNIHTSARFVSG
jgi:hypothetical protein